MIKLDPQSPHISQGITANDEKDVNVRVELVMNNYKNISKPYVNLWAINDIPMGKQIKINKDEFEI